MVYNTEILTVKVLLLAQKRNGEKRSVAYAPPEATRHKSSMQVIDTKYIVHDIKYRTEEFVRGKQREAGSIEAHESSPIGSLVA